MFDVCVVGGGPVGLFTAAELSARGKRVVLLEAGRHAGDNKRLLLGPRPARGSHRGSEAAWTTGLGGTSQLWGGQLWPWQHWEFAGREQVGVDAWPLAFDEIFPYYERVLRSLGLPVAHDQIHGGFGDAGRLPQLTGGDFFLRYSSWIDHSRRNFRKNPVIQSKLREASLEEGTIVNRIGQISAESADVHFRNLAGEASKISAANVVLAAGTIGNARIIRNSEIAQDLPALGLGFLDHVSKRIAEFDVFDWNKFRSFSTPKSVSGVLASPRLVPSVEFQERHQILPCYAHWEFEAPPSGAVASLRSWLRAGQAGRPRPPLVKILTAVVHESVWLTEAIARSLIYSERPVPRSSRPYLRLDVQQPTRRDVRLEWTENQLDPEFPSLALSWRTGKKELATMRMMADKMLASLSALDIGARATAVPQEDPFEDIFHMMGGTRMASTSLTGVVDTDCRIFGTSNVYIAGASVFPNGGMANPTFTALALAARIGDKIAE